MSFRQFCQFLIVSALSVSSVFSHRFCSFFTVLTVFLLSLLLFSAPFLLFFFSFFSSFLLLFCSLLTVFPSSLGLWALSAQSYPQPQGEGVTLCAEASQTFKEKE